MLRDNLREVPGHAQTVDALVELMLARGRALELAQLLSEQAAAVENKDMRESATALWARAADLFETPLGDVPSAIAANERVVALSASPARVATLAKLYLAQQMPAQAAKWLARRLEHAEAQDRVPLLLQLARAELQAEQHDAAVRTLEAAFEEAPKNAEVRKLLLQLHRTRGDHEALARTLSKAAAAISDGDTVIAYAREAAEVYRVGLGREDLATSVLARALEFAPQDRSLGLMLAQAKLAAGSFDEAESLLVRLIEGSGARRSAERAFVHLTLARVLQAKRQIDGALDQLDIAQKMDGSNIDAVRMLAELAREAGQLERAERAYRALLLMVREFAGTSPNAPMAAGEVLMQLSWIAEDLGQQEKASERCESALEALIKSEADARRVQAAVLARGDLALLRRVLETRLHAATVPQVRAEISAEYAEILGGPLADPKAAFERWLQAVDLHPAAPQYHHAALRLAREFGAVDRYNALLEELLERSNTPAQSYARCEVLLRLGELAEGGDPERAFELYRAAEATGVREVDVWRALASCAARARRYDAPARAAHAPFDPGRAAKRRRRVACRCVVSPGRGPACACRRHVRRNRIAVACVRRGPAQRARRSHHRTGVSRRRAEPRPARAVRARRAQLAGPGIAARLPRAPGAPRRRAARRDPRSGRARAAARTRRARRGPDAARGANRCGASRRQRPRAMGADRARRPALRTARPGGRGEVVARGSRKRER